MRPEKAKLAPMPAPETVSVRDILCGLESGETDMVCVLGPTASGKTRYAVRLARELGRAEIISADSRQVFRGMDIGTGKDLSEYGDVPFHLIDIRDAGQKYSVYEFVKDFRPVFDGIRSRGGVPILCGGTGLYINAVTAGYDFSERIPLSGARQVPELAPKTFFIGTLVNRETRNVRIDARLEARLEDGMVEEVRSLLDGTNPGCAGGKPVPAETLISYGLEYRFVTLYLKGEIGYDEMRLKLSTAIHQFAKRQMTWFRGMERSGVHIHWVEV